MFRFASITVVIITDSTDDSSSKKSMSGRERDKAEQNWIVFKRVENVILPNDKQFSSQTQYKDFSCICLTVGLNNEMNKVERLQILCKH